jgi:hypothetical protein
VTKKTKEYWNMTQAELAEATREFDREFVADTFRDMTPPKRKPGGPRLANGAGAEKAPPMESRLCRGVSTRVC